MKIALLSEKYPPDPGGLAVSVERLGRLLASVGHQVHIFSLGTLLEPGEINLQEVNGILVSRLGVHRRTDDTLSAWFDHLQAQHKRHPYDLLHAYFVTQAGFVAAYAGRLLELPVVVSARGNDLDRAVFDPGKAAHILFALQHASAVTANSQELVKKARALSDNREVIYIPNGIDTTRFSPAPRDGALAGALGLKNQPVLGFVGEARHKKGLSSLLLAFRQIARQRPTSLLIVGSVRSGEDKDLLKVFQKQNPSLDLIVTGDVPASLMPRYYSLIDVLAMPSVRDGLPNALLEGMACERAIVSTPVGGIPDAIRHGEDGLLIPANDFSSLADAVQQLLGDPSLRQRLGRKARETVSKKFTLQQELEENLAIYHQILGSD
jgi:glycosyltransferase involved in cell wall biosynthesis